MPVTKSPTTATNLTLSVPNAVSWGSPTWGLTSDDLYATVPFSDSTATGSDRLSKVPSHYLYVSGFGFTLPVTAAIDGIEVTVERHGIGNTEDYNATLAYWSTQVTLVSPGKPKSAVWPSTDGTAVYGSATDAWNRVWTPEEINSSSFGFALAAEGVPDDFDAALVDSIKITIYWHREINLSGTGGASVNGSHTKSLTYNTAFLGGVQSSGHGSLIYPTIFASGGAQVSGVALEVASYWFQGGASIDGDVLLEYTSNISSTGDALAGGIADVSTIEAEPVSGGTSVSGEAWHSHGYEPLGGSIADGEATVDWTYNHAPEGGVLASGDSFVDPYVMLAQILAGGSAIVEIRVGELVEGGGCQLGGSAVPGMSATMEGGIAINGTGTETARYPSVMTGGLSIYSDPEHAIIRPFWDTAEGGASLGGIAIVDPYWPLGGIAASGEASVARTHFPQQAEYQWTNYLTPGEVVPPESHSQSGFAVTSVNPTTNLLSWNATYTLGTARYIRIKGPATEGVNSDTIQIYIGQISGYDSPNVGSTTITEQQKADLLAGLWYWELMSWSNETIRGQILVREGVSVGGLALLPSEEEVSGGLAVSGEVVPTQSYRVLVSGGSAVGGSAVVDGKKAAIVASGGSTVGGSAETIFVYTLDCSGGVKINGSHIEQVAYSPLIEGGTKVNGSSIIGISPSVGGGIAVNGQYLETYLIWPRPSGGASVAPSHSQTFFDWYVSEVALKVGGKSLPSKMQVWQTRHFGYGRCMSSDNIYTTVTYDAALTPPTSDVSPDLEDARFRIQHEPGWCDVEEKCEEGVLPKVVQRRQGEYLPPKLERATRRDRGIARISDAL